MSIPITNITITKRQESVAFDVVITVNDVNYTTVIYNEADFNRVKKDIKKLIEKTNINNKDCTELAIKLRSFLQE